MDDIKLPKRPKLRHRVAKIKKSAAASQLDETVSSPLEHVVSSREETASASTNSNGRFHRLNLSRKQYFLIGAIGLVIGGLVGSYFIFFRKSPALPESLVSELPAAPEPKPTTEPSRLTGVTVPIKLNKLPVTAVMIENSPDARPQAGLVDAGIVFEAIAEGGITRFLALYLESQPGHIGPVRSVRPYYLDFMVPFDAALAHAGGSAVALAQIQSQKIKDLDHSGNAGTYQRVNTRFAPHNLYTSRAQLLKLHNAKNYKTSKFTSLVRKEEAPLKKPSAKTIEFKISRFLYNTSYAYDPKTNSYKRSMAGQPHKDERSGKQIMPKVLVAIITSHNYAGIYSVYGTTGKGTVLIFQDGGVTKGTWHKAGRGSQYSFRNAKGKPLGLNPGQTWITMIKPGGVTSAP